MLLLVAATAASSFAVADAHTMEQWSKDVRGATGRPHRDVHARPRVAATGEERGRVAADASADGPCPPGASPTACARVAARHATANAEHRIARHHERVTDKTRSRVGETRAGAHHDVLSASRVEERRASRVLQRQIERRQVRATARIAEARREANALRNDADAQRKAADEAKAELERLDAALAKAEKTIAKKDERSGEFSGAAKLAMESAVHSISAAHEAGREQGRAEALQRIHAERTTESDAVEALRRRLEKAEARADELVRAEAAAEAEYDGGKAKSAAVEKALRFTLESAQRDAADAKAKAKNARARFAKELRAREAAEKKDVRRALQDVRRALQDVRRALQDASRSRRAPRRARRHRQVPRRGQVREPAAARAGG